MSLSYYITEHFQLALSQNKELINHCRLSRKLQCSAALTPDTKEMSEGLRILLLRQYNTIFSINLKHVWNQIIMYSQTEHHHQYCFQHCFFCSCPTQHVLAPSHKLMVLLCLLDMGILIMSRLLKNNKEMINTNLN